MLKRLHPLLVAAFSLGLCQAAFAQVHIVENDTALCVPQPLTLHATVDSGQVATGLVIADDTYSDVIPLAFPFTFYGHTYNQMRLSTNAYIKFGPTDTYSPYQIDGSDPFPTATQGTSEATSPITNVIMGPWQDTYPGAFGAPASFADAMDYKTVGTAPNRIFVFSFCEVPMFSCTSLNFSGQILLFETSNIIEVHLNHKSVCASWITGQAVLGVQDSTGQYATIVPGHNVGTQWTAENKAWRFTATSDTSYAWDTIPYAPIPIYSGGGVRWYDNGTLLGSGVTMPTNLPTGIHQIVAEVHGCYVSSSYDTIQIIVGAPAVQSHTDVPCAAAANGTASVHLANNFPYSVVWSDSSGAVIGQGNVTGGDTITGLHAGTYTLLLTDTAGCVSTLDYTINIVPNAAILNIGQQNVPCATATNGFAAVQLSNATPYVSVWTNYNDSILQQGTVSGADTLFNIGAGNYNVSVADTFGCVSDTAYTIAIVPVPVQPTVSAPNVDCPESHRGYVAIHLTNGGTFHSAWTDTSGTVVGQHMFAGNDTLHNQGPGDYFLTLTDDAGCTYNFSYNIGADTYVVDFTQDKDTICAGGSVSFTPVTNETVTLYTWTYGDTFTSNDVNAAHIFHDPGTFSVNLTIVDSVAGCTASVSHPVYAREIIKAAFIPSAPVCAGAPVYFSDISSAHPAQWNWDFAGQATSTDQNPNFTFSTPGTYTVALQVVDSFCGVDSRDTTVLVNPFPVVNLQPDSSVICKGQSVSFDAGNAGDIFVWNNGATTQTVSPTFDEDADVRVTVSHLGCEATDSAFVDVACDMQMPNAFTPNGDNNNDYFRPYGHNILNYQLEVYDRWGHLAYSTNNTHPGSAGEGWNGKINGKDAEIGVYSYTVHGVLLTNLVVDQTGNVTLLR